MVLLTMKRWDSGFTGIGFYMGIIIRTCIIFDFKL